ncbi:MAG: hypothetical protein WD624_00045, partial [Rhodospirillales bacterium]
TKMTSALAPVVLGGFLCALAFGADAQKASKPSESQVTNAKECAQGIMDTKEARATNPELGPKAAKAFDEILELAVKRCENNEFSNAAELLNVARSMVASE